MSLTQYLDLEFTKWTAKTRLILLKYKAGFVFLPFSLGTVLLFPYPVSQILMWLAAAMLIKLGYKFTYLMSNSADPDKLASSEASWSGSTLFEKRRAYPG